MTNSVVTNSKFRNIRRISITDTLKLVDSFEDVDRIHDYFNNINKVRVPDTPGHTHVRQYIVSEFQKMGWVNPGSIVLDAFQDETPFGEKTFTNIIMTHNPSASKRLVLAAHYDSKLFPEPNKFVASTDSALPCSLLISVAKTLTPLLDTRRNSDTSLQIIFFDGEEAFEHWSDKDSLYGARHLAELWETKYVNNNTESELERMDVLVLLDILGFKGMKIQNHFVETTPLFERLHILEKKVRERLEHSGRMKDITRSGFFIKKGKRWGLPDSRYRVIDDHVPFQQRNVPCVHIISGPFPKEWHTDGDNESIIDWDSVRIMDAILRLFVAEYLQIKNIEKI